MPGFRTLRRQTLAAICVVLGWQAAGAHDFWIEPAGFRPEPGAQLSVTLRVGEDFSGTSQPLIPNWFTDFSLYAAGERRLVEGFVGDDPAGSFPVAAAGTQIIGYRSTRAFVEIEPVKFDQYLRDEGLEWVIEARRERGESRVNAREYYSRCAKALILPAGAAAGRGHDRRLGYTLELVPEADPYALAVGDSLPLRLFYRDRPITGILVVAFTAGEPEAKIRRRTDADGRVELTLDRAGDWLVKAVHIIEVPAGDSVADWESFWASLTFALAP